MEKERGFALVEVLLATGIMTTVVVGISTLVIVSMKANAASGDQTTCVALAQERLEKLRHQNYESIPRGGSISSCTSGFCDLIDADGNGRSDYRVQWTVANATTITSVLTDPSVRILQVDVRCTSLRSAGGQSGTPKTITLSTYRAPSGTE